MALAILILAAGQGNRFKSSRPKILHALVGAPLLAYPLRMARALRASKTVVVVSPTTKTAVQQLLTESGIDATIAIQRQPRGTADAVRAAQATLRRFRGHVLILPGDVPLLRKETLQQFVRTIETAHARCGALTVTLDDPTGYGRIVRGLDGRIRAITEERDADEHTRAIHEINSGIICCEAQWLWSALKQVTNSNAQREFYLTDIAALAAAEGEGMLPILHDDASECLGVNSRGELAVAESILRDRIVTQWMTQGVTFRDPQSVCVDHDVVIGRDTVIDQNVALHGNTRIGAECHIGQGSIITVSQLGRGVVVKPYSVIEAARVGDNVTIGPFARLRPGTRLDADVNIGNFVEIKKSWLKRGAKANHLTYLGDATVGTATNVGCGTITCNYDGVAKYQTIIGNDVFIGSDTQFVAPVRVGHGATTAAGSVITEDVPANALAVARGRQVVKKNWKRPRKRK